MIEVILSLLFGIWLLWFVERQHQKGKIGIELSRKIIHVTVGLTLVTWPFFVSWGVILAVEVVYLVAAVVVRHVMPLSSQHGVNRRSWGEFFFSFGVISTILLGATRWIFILAILHLALADAAAALVGVRYGSNNTYRVFGQKKSVAGTSAFFVISVMLVALTFVFVPNHVTSANMLPLILLPFVTTLGENIGAYGLDNLLIPLLVIVMLRV